MAYRTASAIQILTAATTVGNIVVPAGVISSDYCVVAISWGTSTVLSATISGPVGMSTGPITARRADSNLSWQLFWVKGVVAGNTVTVTYSAGGSANKNIQLFAFTADLGTPGAIYSRNGVSLATQVAPVINVTPGAGVLVFALERTTATGTVVSSKTSGSGETVSDVVYSNQDVDPNITSYWGRFTAVGGTTPAGPLTLTYNSASGNGIALLFPEVAGTELAPTITATFTPTVQFTATALNPSSPATFKAASTMMTNANHLTIPVPDGTLSSDYVYCLTAWGNSTLRDFDYTGTPSAVLPGQTIIAPRVDTNVGWTLQVFQGLVEGQSVVVDSPGTGPIAGRLYTFSQALAAPGVIGARTASVSTVDIPSMTAVTGKPIFVFAVERTTADGTVVTNAVNSSGAAITPLAYIETAADPDISMYLGSYVPASTDSGTVTLTYSGPSTNAAAVNIPAVSAPATITALFEPLTNTALRSRQVQFTAEVPYPAGLVRVNVGRPEYNAIRVKALTKSVTVVRLAVSANSSMTAPVFSGNVTPDAKGYSYLEVSGLLADTDYWWRVEIDGIQTGTTNKLRTWPAPGVPAAVTAILVGSCTAGYGSTAPGPTNPDTYAYMRAKVDAAGRSARLFIDLGDDFYPCSQGSPNGTMFPLNETIIRGWWEGQHQQSQRAAFHKQIPATHTWSDNDYLGSNSDSTMNPDVAALAATIRRQVLCDAPLPAPDGKGLYWSALLGRVLLINTDARSYSSNTLLSNPTAGKSMLGTTQKTWLKSQFSRSDYVACIWFHDNQWVGNPTTSNSRPAVDNWQAFAVERQEIADYITANEIKLLMYVHGDNHTIAYDDGTNNAYGHFPFAMVAPLYNDAQALALPVTGGSYPTVSTAKLKQFSWIEITDDGFHVSATFKGIDVMTGAEVLRVTGTSATTSAPPAPALLHEFHYNLDVADVVGGPLPGQDGKDGTIWFWGAGPPTPEPAGAKSGDLYLDTVTGDVYELTGV